jgi:hypothetical protein
VALTDKENSKSNGGEANRKWALPGHCAARKECIRVNVQMDSIFSCPQKKPPASGLGKYMLAFFLSFVMFGANVFVHAASAQTGADPAAEFKKAAAELSDARLAGGEDDAARMEKALAYLDSVAAGFLNAPAGPNLDEANRSLGRLASHTPPVGENYRLVKFGGAHAIYLMVINFGLGGPAAVRVYAGTAGHYAMSAHIDRFAQKDFLDSDIEAVLVSSSEPVFVTVSGRTDDLSTGAFTAFKAANGNALRPSKSLRRRLRRNKGSFSLQRLGTTAFRQACACRQNARVKAGPTRPIEIRAVGRTPEGNQIFSFDDIRSA